MKEINFIFHVVSKNIAHNSCIYFNAQIIEEILKKKFTKFNYLCKSNLKKNNDINIVFSNCLGEININLIKEGTNILIITESLNNEHHYNNLRKFHSYFKIILDYTNKNIKKFKLNKHILLPYSYNIYLENLYKGYEKNDDKEIDILFYGTLNNRRNNILNKLKKFNIVIMDKFINIQEQIKTILKSKIVLIIHYYQYNLCIDFYRISDLISNKIFIIHESPDKNCDNEILMNKIISASYNNIVSKCDEWLNKSQEERNKHVEILYKFFKENYNYEKKFSEKVLPIIS